MVNKTTKILKMRWFPCILGNGFQSESKSWFSKSLILWCSLFFLNPYHQLAGLFHSENLKISKTNQHFLMQPMWLIASYSSCILLVSTSSYCIDRYVTALEVRKTIAQVEIIRRYTESPCCTLHGIPCRPFPICLREAITELEQEFADPAKPWYVSLELFISFDKLM
jgi:hypothetical protein